MYKKDVVAMLLAGGQGTRLKDLTEDVAKPAVHFGGKYRIIDFPLSNCSNSGIDTVGVLTQYEPLELNSYLGHGDAWDLDSINGGISVLPPFSSSNNVNWYTGTADAVARNFKYIDLYDPEYVLILSGDHIYKMDYAKMINYHIEKKADVTISVIEVDINEASRFGILNTDEDGRIIEFEEKPKEPKSNLASMGIYVFNYDVLRKALLEDLLDENSSNDFGKDIIPKLMKEGKEFFAYNFYGYWKDVGTVDSLWQANMDLLDEDSSLNLYDSSWPIYSVSQYLPPHYVDEKAKIECSLVSDGCKVYGEVEKSVLYYDIEVKDESVIKNSVLMPNVKVGREVVLDYCLVQQGVNIPDEIVIRGDKDNIILVSKKYIKEHMRSE